MIARRGFLEMLTGAAGFAATGGCALCGKVDGAQKPLVAAQLWSINKIMWKEPERCLAGLKVAGYDGVEFAGYGSAKHGLDLAKMLLAAGLKGMGTHVNGNTDLVGDKLKATLDFAAEAGLQSITTPHAKRETADEYKRFGYEMGLAAEAAKRYGIKVGIHTTYHHFTTKFGNETAWDMMFKEASPLLQQQVDTSNSFHVGVDVVELLKKYAGRHWSVHLKENTPTKTATLGEKPSDGGEMIPWDSILGYLKSESVKWYVVEAEAVPDSLKPLEDSRKFLRRFGV